jgi:hypothetical protein
MINSVGEGLLPPQLIRHISPNREAHPTRRGRRLDVPKPIRQSHPSTRVSDDLREQYTKPSSYQSAHPRRKALNVKICRIS